VNVSHVIWEWYWDRYRETSRKWDRGGRSVSTCCRSCMTTLAHEPPSVDVWPPTNNQHLTSLDASFPTLVTQFDIMHSLISSVVLAKLYS